MLTDTEARDLLHAAAATIEVEPDHPLPAVARPLIWPMLAAAAVVIAVVVTTLAIADRGPSPQPSNPPSPSPNADRMPSVMGLDLEDALDLMIERKLNVELVNQQGCVSERVVAGSSPGVGARVQPQDSVKLTVLNPTSGLCQSASPGSVWSLLRFALDVAPAPPFADTVTLYPGGGQPIVLTAAEASDPDNWEVCDGDLCDSALSILAKAATQPSPTGAGSILDVWERPRDFDGVDPCMGGAELDSEGTYLGITIAPPTDGVATCPQITAAYANTGLLEAVAIPLPQERDPEPEPTPDAKRIGEMFIAFARGESDALPVDTPVGMHFSGELKRTMSARDAMDRRNWLVCRFGSGACVRSATGLLADYPGVVRLSAQLPLTACDHVFKTQVPWSADVTLTPGDDCPRWAVQLAINDAGQIVGLNQVTTR